MAEVIRLNRTGSGTVNSKVKSGPVAPRYRNVDLRAREHLYLDEVEAMMRAAKKVGRHGHRDATLILMLFRHGFRVAEAIDLRCDQIRLEDRNKTIYVTRAKNGTPATHPLDRREANALRELRKKYPDSNRVFVTERGSALSQSVVRHIVKRAGKLAKIPFPVHPHQLRHACGYHLANRPTDTRTIQAYLGHRNIQHTTRYTELASDRFNGLFD
jgi:type 1 fimbriae regulatory protein FimB/type 1 fimbriae regulatory protein FimE